MESEVAALAIIYTVNCDKGGGAGEIKKNNNN